MTSENTLNRMIWVVTSVVVGVCCLALLGWLLDIPFLKSIMAHWISMRIVTALSLICCAAALLLAHHGQGVRWRQRLWLGLGILVGLTGLVSFLTYCGQIHWGQEMGWVYSPLLRELFSPPARMAPVTALLFMGFGSALALLANSTPRGDAISHALTLPLAIMSYLVLVGYLFHEDGLHTWMNVAVAFNTGIAFLALAIGIFCVRPQTWLMRVFTSQGVGGLIARRLLPAVVVAPLLIGWLCFTAAEAGILRRPLETTVAVISNGVLVLLVLWFTARSANETDERRRRTEEELYHQREWFRVTLNSIGDGVMTTDTAGRITFLNPVASALSSWKPQEALGRPVQKVFQIINEETREPAEDVVGQVLGEGCVVTQTDHTALVTRDGSKIPIEGSAAPITDSSGNLLGAVLVFHDVMERRRTQDALRKSEERYRNLFVTMAEGFALHELICDAEGRPADYRFLEVNPAFERLTGLQSIEVLGHTIREVIPGIESIWIERYGKVALTGEPDQFEAWSDVLGRWYEVRVSQSEPGRFAVVFLDITHRRQAEEALLESQRDLNRAQAVAHIGSWRLDVRRNELFWSDETHRIFGIPRGTPLSYETFLAAIHPEDREVVDGRWQAALRGDRYDLEHRIVVGDRIKWVRQRAELEFDNEGGLLGAFGTVQDITGRKGMEIELRRARDELELRVRERTDELAQALGDSKTYAARLELLNQELQEFAFVASHDLAEPLRKIQTFGERLRTKCEMSLGEEGCDYLLRMESAANRMQVLLASLLAYSRVTTQANPLRETDLGRVAQEVLSDLEIPIEISGGHVEIGSLPLVRADSAQMYQLLQNLIHNALKYSSKDEPLVRVYGHAANNVAEIFVEDNGIGFDEKYLDRIFKPFQRLHGRNSEYEGTGMGLAICRKIVERHGGTITAKSVPGKGSTFIVTLPVKQRSGKADQPQLSRA